MTTNIPTMGREGVCSECGCETDDISANGLCPDCDAYEARRRDEIAEEMRAAKETTMKTKTTSTAFELAMRLRAMGFDAKHEDGGHAGDFVVMKLTPLPEVLVIGDALDNWGANVYATLDTFENGEMLDVDITTGLNSACKDVNVIARALLVALREWNAVRGNETTNAGEWIDRIALDERIESAIDRL